MITELQAAGLIRYHGALEAAARPVDRRVALAVLDAVCDLAHRGGAGMTPTHVRLVLAEVVAAAGPRPPVQVTGGNDAVRAWDAELARALVAALEAA